MEISVGGGSLFVIGRLLQNFPVGMWDTTKILKKKSGVPVEICTWDPLITGEELYFLTKFLIPHDFI